jgi:hypothetical protein
VDVGSPLESPQQVAEVCAWLSTEAAQDVTSQIIDIQNGLLSIMQQPKIIKSFSTDGMWTLDDIDKAIPQLVEARKKHDEDVVANAGPTPIN